MLIFNISIFFFTHFYHPCQKSRNYNNYFRGTTYDSLRRIVSSRFAYSARLIFLVTMSSRKLFIDLHPNSKRRKIRALSSAQASFSLQVPDSSLPTLTSATSLLELTEPLAAELHYDDSFDHLPDTFEPFPQSPLQYDSYDSDDFCGSFSSESCESLDLKLENDFISSDTEQLKQGLGSSHCVGRWYQPFHIA